MSTPGKGTSIELLLPRSEAKIPAAPPTPASLIDGPGSRGRETVLIAEDEEGVRLLATETLQRRGYRVLAAESGEAALKLAGSYDGTIHVLLTDVIMPGIKGPELAERMRALRPGIRVLMMSGYSADIVRPSDLRDAALLSKPFSPAALTQAVRTALDTRLPSETA
jgi:CheY-like chemotaxis protein